MDFSSGAVLKNPPANTGEAGDMDLIPGTRKIPWSRKWQPSVVFLPARFHEQRSKESDTTEHKNTKIQIPLYRWPLVIILYLTDPSFLHCYLFLILFLTRVYYLNMAFSFMKCLGIFHLLWEIWFTFAWLLNLPSTLPCKCHTWLSFQHLEICFKSNSSCYFLKLTLLNFFVSSFLPGTQNLLTPMIFKLLSPKVKVKSLSRIQLFAPPWTVAYQAPPSMGFSKQEYWSGLPFPSPGALPKPGIEPGSPTL